MGQAKKKVLIVDDEPGIIRILGIKLRISGYEVMTAFNGERALELVESGNPDIMLLDIIMPGKDGFQVLQTLRSTCELPVIAFSARSENAQKALELGANDFVSKPFDVDTLITKVRKILVKTS
jgi:DNA-binding response OmpR family regulator